MRRVRFIEGAGAGALTRFLDGEDQWQFVIFFFRGQCVLRWSVARPSRLSAAFIMPRTRFRDNSETRAIVNTIRSIAHFFDNEYGNVAVRKVIEGTKKN